MLARYFLQAGVTVTQRQIIVPDIWSVIFSHLEPCFLFDVVQVSKAFNRAASHDTVFFKKLQQYFPDEDLQAIPVPVSERQKGKFLFRTLYAKKFSTLKSSASRRLLAYIIEEDIEQIRKFNIDGDQLFEMLKEQDADGNDMLFYANRSKNISLYRAIITLYLRHKVSIIQSWNPLTIFDNWLDKVARKVLGFPLDRYEVSNLFILAAAFNLDVIRLITELNPERQWIYDEALVQAVRFGHVETMNLLLEEKCDRFKGSTFKSHRHPLVAAAKYNQLKAATRLLDFEMISSDLRCIESALIEAVRCHSTSVFDLLVSVYMVNSEMNIHAFMKTFIFDKIIESGHADIAEAIMRRVADLNDVKFNNVMAFAVRQAIYSGHIDIVKIFLGRGYIPQSYDIYAAKGSNEPEIVELLREARNQYKQSKTAKPGR